MNLCLCGCGKEVTREKNLFLVGHGARTKEIVLKRKQTYLKNWGVENPSQSKEIKEKKRLKSQEHYHTDNPLQSNKIKEKIKQTNLRIRNVEYPGQSEEVKQKIIQTNNKRYGECHYSKTLEGRLIHRIYAIKQREDRRLNGEPDMPCVGYTERECLNELEMYTSVKNILRNDNSFRYIIGRIPDGHIPELKIFIQFDERYHFLDKMECKIYNKDDINCTLELASLGYIVFRISEKNWKENKEKVISDFKEVLSYVGKY